MMHIVKTQRFGELFVKNMFVIYFYMVIIKTYKLKKQFFNKFPAISGDEYIIDEYIILIHSRIISSLIVLENIL